jgi:hypothetical protein
MKVKIGPFPKKGNRRKIDIQIDDLLLPYSFDISIFKDIENLDLIDHINRVGFIFYERSSDS